MNQETRLRIINYLKRNHSSTTGEISSALYMTRANIQYHLQIMQQDGIVTSEIRYQEKKDRRGRPSYYYSLVHDDNENNYQNLCFSLLNIIFNTKEKTDVVPDSVLKEIGESLIPTPLDIFIDRVSHINYIINILNKHHYNARWEAHKDGAFIYFNKCPYLSLLSNFPELCKIDLYMLERLFNCQIKQIKKQNKLNDTSSNCIFVIH